MKTYIGVKQIQARPMALGEYNIHRGWEIPANEDPAAPGYLVVYEDGYQSWSPAEVFEAAYFELSDPTRICAEDVDRFAGEPVARRVDEKTALVTVETLSGFVQHEASSCVDPANYDEALGKKYGYERIQSKLWGHMGFVLQWARNGLKCAPLLLAGIMVAFALNSCRHVASGQVQNATLENNTVLVYAGAPVGGKAPQASSLVELMELALAGKLKADDPRISAILEVPASQGAANIYIGSNVASSTANDTNQHAGKDFGEAFRAAAAVSAPGSTASASQLVAKEVSPTVSRTQGSAAIQASPYTP